jgi:demethylmenaquinone methyltransferase/2-methoxy-6-polyprenyl-1,4-benzoquinol methylase
MDIPDKNDPDFLGQQQAMFTNIARRYDLMNHLMTGWQDNHWRRFTVKQLKLPDTGRLLDLGSGTGNLAQEARHQFPANHIIAADLTLPMMKIGKDRNPKSKVDWLAVDGYDLPFATNSFDGIVSGFLVRNLNNVHKGLIEQFRVLKPGGKIVLLETTKRSKDFISPYIRFYMYRMVPFVSRIIAGSKEAYTYLYKSTQEFLRAEELAAYLAAVGFKKVLFRRFMFGTIAIHWGEK